MHGGHVTLAPRLAAAVVERGKFDLVLASSMTNVAALLGLARRAIGDVPVALYMHENQLTFPLSPDDREDLTYAMVNWTSMVGSDLVIFNSEFHRREWFDELPGLLNRMPDHRHSRFVPAVSDRSVVLPVGAELHALDRVERNTNDRPLVLWNQRWQYDKGPAEFATALTALVDEGLAFDVALAGDRADASPPELLALRNVLGDRLVHDGHADLESYRELLRRSDIVVSAAHHEFFGVAITEAVYAGAFPVLANRVVYPERIPEAHQATCLYDTDAELLERLRWAIRHQAEASAIAGVLKLTMAAFDWSIVAPRYDDVLMEIAEK
jgi:glycosyltransferase involved in cell wall biosynthesis